MTTSNRILLGVNIDHVATLRQARGTRYPDPVKAALFCRSTRGVALKHGYRASFMAKPYLQFPGSGMHVHVSLYDGLKSFIKYTKYQFFIRK